MRMYLSRVIDFHRLPASLPACHVIYPHRLSACLPACPTD